MQAGTHSPAGVTTTRIVGIDVLRGLAVLGILVVNVEQLFLPIFVANAPIDVVPGKPGMLVAWFVTDAFFESKFLTIFSLLFGAGFYLQWMRYQESKSVFVRLYLRRIIALIGFGIIHATFFYYADVLVTYGLTALVLLLFRNRSTRALIRTGVIMLALMTVWHILLSGPEPGAAEQHQEIAENLNTMRTSGTIALGDNTYALPVPPDTIAVHLNGDIHSTGEAAAQTLAFGEGPAWLAIRARLVLFRSFILLFTPLFLLWRTLGLFLIAAGLVKNGFLDVSERAKWKRTAIVCFSTGLPLTIAASILRLKAYESPGVLTFLGSALHDLSALLLAAAISCTVLLLCARGAPGWLGRGLESVGRLALTNYIGQSLVMSLLATSVGLGWFGRLGRLEMLLLCVPVFAAQMLASTVWTRYYRMGPLEWIWRGVTYRAFPRNRLEPAKTPPE